MRTSTRNTVWAGRVLLWEDHGLFVGKAGKAELHESPAIKLCIALEGEFSLSINNTSATPYQAAIIPAGFTHRIDSKSCKMAMLLLAPEGNLGRRFSGTKWSNGIIRLDKRTSELVEILQPTDYQFDENTVLQAIEKVVDLISGTPDFDQLDEMDPRVAQSVERIRAERESGILVKDIAADVDLSESRFSHLFSENMGVPVRRYLLWLRLRDALHMLASAENLTEAAHLAGFSDSAHLTRTFRSALGIAPSDLVRHSSVTSFLR